MRRGTQTQPVAIVTKEPPVVTILSPGPGDSVSTDTVTDQATVARSRERSYQGGGRIGGWHSRDHAGR